MHVAGVAHVTDTARSRGDDCERIADVITDRAELATDAFTPATSPVATSSPEPWRLRFSEHALLALTPQRESGLR